ncbi:MAG: hypothetical protein ACI9S8_002523 [Chlamydiales bacterium]|jgi:hypothetical protein
MTMFDLGTNRITFHDSSFHALQDSETRVAFKSLSEEYDGSIENKNRSIENIGSLTARLDRNILALRDLNTELQALDKNSPDHNAAITRINNSVKSLMDDHCNIKDEFTRLLREQDEARSFKEKLKSQGVEPMTRPPFTETEINTMRFYSQVCSDHLEAIEKVNGDNLKQITTCYDKFRHIDCILSRKIEEAKKLLETLSLGMTTPAFQGLRSAEEENLPAIGNAALVPYSPFTERAAELDFSNLSLTTETLIEDSVALESYRQLSTGLEERMLPLREGVCTLGNLKERVLLQTTIWDQNGASAETIAKTYKEMRKTFSQCSLIQEKTVTLRNELDSNRQAMSREALSERTVESVGYYSKISNKILLSIEKINKKNLEKVENRLIEADILLSRYEELISELIVPMQNIRHSARNKEPITSTRRKWNWVKSYMISIKPPQAGDIEDSDADASDAKAEEFRGSASK